MNNKSTFVFLIACGLILFALVARNGEILLLAMPLVIYLIIGILQCPAELSLRARRTIDKAQVAAQEPIRIEVAVENEGKGLTNLLLEDPFPRALSISEGRAQQRLALSTGDASPVRYIARATRGIYGWDSIHITASDPFGLFGLRRAIPAPAEIQVRPAPMRIRNVAFQPRATLHAPGSTPAHRAGDGTDFWGIREYRPGDPRRRLNWRLRSKYPHQMFVNEYEGEEVADFGLILDARRLTSAHEAEAALFEASVSAAASLSESLLKNGNRVALLIFGEASTCLFPGYGKKQLTLILRELSRASLGRNLSSQYLEYFPARVFPGRSVILIFSALDARDVGTYARLRAFGYEVLLVSPDPVEYAGRALPPTENNNLAIRAARLERMVQLKRLLKMGVGVVDWQVNEPLGTALEGTARTMARRRNL